MMRMHNHFSLYPHTCTNVVLPPNTPTTITYVE